MTLKFKIFDPMTKKFLFSEGKTIPELVEFFLGLKTPMEYILGVAYVPFSGILDANKKELYVGDIVEMELATVFGPYVKSRGLIVFDDTRKQFYVTADTRIAAENQSILPKYVCSLYEHPELNPIKQ